MFVRLLLSLAFLLGLSSISEVDARGFSGGFSSGYGGGVSVSSGFASRGSSGAMNLYRPYSYGYGGYPYGYGYGGDYAAGIYSLEDSSEQNYDAEHNSDGSLIGSYDAGPSTNNPPAPTTSVPAVTEAGLLQSADQTYNWGSE